MGRLNTRHYTLVNCKQGDKRRLRHKTLQRYFEASMVLFQINAKTLIPSEAVPYLVHITAYNKRDWDAVYQNLQIYWRWWVM